MDLRVEKTYKSLVEAFTELVGGASVETLATFISGGVIQAVLTWWHSGHACDIDVAAGLEAVLVRLLP